MTASQSVGASLALSLNRQEIESVLRGCVRNLADNEQVLQRLSVYFDSLGLDSHFICAMEPFAREPQKSPRIVGHRYSASQLSAYLACPRRFFFEKILKIAPERPEDFGLGELIHLVLEQFHREVREFVEDSDALTAMLMNIFDNIWRAPRTGPDGSRVPAFSTKFAVALQRATVERRATEILRRYLGTEAKQAKDRSIIACEQRSDFSVRGYPFIARMDRVDRSPAGHIIIDYKTSSSGPKTPRSIKKKFLNVDGDPAYRPEDFQLPLYLLAGRSEGYAPVELSYYWLRQQDSSGSFRKSFLRVCEGEPDCLSAEEMNEVEITIGAVVERIAAGDFRAHPRSSFECAWCSFGDVCDEEQQDEPSDE